MKHLPLLLGFSLVLQTLPAFADVSPEDLDEKALRASKILKNLVEEKLIPKLLIKEATCVAAVTLYKGGLLGLGAKGGKGVASCRTKDGWSNPSFLNLTGANLGPQIGVGKVDMVLVFVGEDSTDQLKKRNFSGDAQATLIAGPVGREALVGVDLKLENGIYSYSKGKGLYFGATIGAVMIKPDRDSNELLYPGVDATKILKTPADGKVLPASASTFLESLEEIDPRSED